METALIVIGVAVFLIVDGILLFFVLRRHRGADDYGVISLPGEATITLPAGKANLVYQEYPTIGSFKPVPVTVPMTLEEFRAATSAPYLAPQR